MIKTPYVINGEHLDMKGTRKALFEGCGIYYQSKKKWFLSTLGIVLPICLICIVVLLVVLSCINFSSQHPWGEVFLMSFICPAIVIPPTLIGTYIQSFVTIRRMTQTLSDFVHKWFSKGTKIIVQPRPLNYFIKTVDGWDIELAFIKEESESFRKANIIAAIYIIPPMQMDRIVEEWYKYCQEKNSCRKLHIVEDIVYAYYSIDGIDQGNVLETIDQMKYLIQRFHITPEKMIHDNIDQEEAKKRLQAQQS